MNRREFLASSLAGTMALATTHVTFLRSARADTLARRLKIESRTLEINGKAAKVFGLIGPDGKQGLGFDAGSLFDVSLENALAEPTLVHWHGLTPPWPQDGVPDNPAPLLAPSETRAYSFPVGPGGTHWMHAHTLQEQNLLAAPLIVRTAEDRTADEQEVVVLLHDFSFTPAVELLAKLKGTSGMGAAASGHMAHMMPGMAHSMPSMGTGHDMAAMKPKSGMSHDAMGHMQMGDMGAMDVNDIEYDAYLANDRTLADPEQIRVEKGGRIRLRIINGATSTAFTIATGALVAELIAVDGQAVAPVSGTAFPVSMGQRLDLRLTIPAGGGAFPILALREDAPERAGIILATAGAPIAKLPVKGGTKGPILDSGLEPRLKALSPLAVKSPDLSVDLALTGSMQGYTWAIEGPLDGDALKVKAGQRVEVTMTNKSMMSHPMHLHGHHFQVVAVNGQRIAGAVRDTVFIPPMGRVTIAFDATNPGRWPLHCHHLYHMATGMMAFVTYDKLG